MRADFPIFQYRPELVYLDSAATTQKPTTVTQAVQRFYQQDYASIHRGLYPLSVASSQAVAAVRAQLAAFIGAANPHEVIFTKNATESLNFLASSLGKTLKAGDQIILSQAEHHANILPWQQLAREKQLELRFVKIDQEGSLDLENFRSLVTEQTKIVSLTHCSNVLGRIIPLASVKKILEEQGSVALFIADASQSLPHVPCSVAELGCDFLVASGHKLYGPAGTGLLWGRAELLEELPPYQTGGDMVVTVSETEATFQPLPDRLEAGTPNLEGIIGLGAALSYLSSLGLTTIEQQTAMLASYARTQIEQLPGAKVVGNPSPESGIISFTIDRLHPHDLADELGKQQICIRAGNHCAMPLHTALGLAASARISLGIYNTQEDIDRFIAATVSIIQQFSHE